MSRTIYCISGMGADDRIFKNLRLNGYVLKHISWLRPHKYESIGEYATRMATSIEEEHPLLLGVSFGGMVAIEIARQRPVHKLILVSSIKCTAELPRWMRMAGRLKINRLLPSRQYNFTEKIDNNRLGVSNEEEREMVRKYRQSADAVYVEWAVNQILNWKNEWIPDRVTHIHGDRDKIFPVKKIKATYVLKGATHFMIYNRAKEVSECITRELKK